MGKTLKTEEKMPALRQKHVHDIPLPDVYHGCHLPDLKGVKKPRTNDQQRHPDLEAFRQKSLMMPRRIGGGWCKIVVLC